LETKTAALSMSVLVLKAILRVEKLEKVAWQQKSECGGGNGECYELLQISCSQNCFLHLIT